MKNYSEWTRQPQVVFQNVSTNDEVRKKVAKKIRENQKLGKGKKLTNRQRALCNWVFYVNIPKPIA